MSLLGSVFTFFGPVVGALLLRTMDADITQNYPEIRQLFLGGVLVLILFGLPGGIVGFIQERDVGSGDDHATRTAKLLRLFRHKSWMFFGSALLFTTFFGILQSPGAWLLPRMREFVPFALGTWGIVPCALLQLVIGGVVLWLLLRRADRFNRIDGALLLAPAGRRPRPACLSRHAALGAADRAAVGHLHRLLARPGGFSARLAHQRAGNRRRLTPCCCGSKP